MKVKLPQDALAGAVAFLKPILKPDPLSVYGQIRAEAIAGDLHLAATDGELELVYRLEVQVDAEGAALFPGALFCSIANALPVGVVAIAAATKTPEPRYTIGNDSNSNQTTYRLASYAARAYPTFAALEPEAVEFQIPANILEELFRKSIFAAAPVHEPRGILRGVNIALPPGGIAFTATDGRRLAHVETALDRLESLPEFDITLPLKTCTLLRSLLHTLRDGADITVKTDRKRIEFVAGGWLLKSVLADGAYPAWRNVIPGQPEHSAILNRADFLAGLARATVATGDDKAVKVALAPGECTIKAANTYGTATVTLKPCTISTGGSARFDFNPRLLKDALEAFDDDTFTLAFGWGGAFGPVLVQQAAVPAVVAIMPLRERGKKEAE